MIKFLKNIITGYYKYAKYLFNKHYRDNIKVLALKRIRICEKCEFFYPHSRNCMICGCFCDIKVKVDFELDDKGKSIDGCPDGRW